MNLLLQVGAGVADAADLPNVTGPATTAPPIELLLQIGAGAADVADLPMEIAAGNVLRDEYESDSDYSPADEFEGLDDDGVEMTSLIDSESESEDTYGGRLKKMKNEAARLCCWDNAQRLNKIAQEKIWKDATALSVDKTAAPSIEDKESGMKDHRSKRERDRERAKRS